jgi:hypothetical protein
MPWWSRLWSATADRAPGGTIGALLNRERRFFGEPSPRLSLEGCDMHQRLLAAYGKLHAQAAT